MPRNLDVEFRGNGPPDELYSRLIRNGAVMHMKNTCSPTPADVRIATLRRAAEAAAGSGAAAAQRIGAPGVRLLGHRWPERPRRR
ncbi:hypothetical protein ACF09I_10440 [Streptomyces sp. NPDC014940]|uniref:hypothetical protein n=1 Tax=Streptomyces sp. NPDC014940 TaxID=3364932 RepID=UPI0036FE70A1